MPKANEAPYVDAALTDFSKAIMNDPSMYLADILAPRVRVSKSSGKYYTYDMEAMRIVQNRREGVTESTEIAYTISDDSYNCVNYALGKTIDPDDVEDAASGIDEEQDAVQYITEMQALARENRVATILTNASFITQTAGVGADWTTAASGTPKADILLGCKTIYNAIHRFPNAIVIPYDVATYMIQTTEFTAGSQYVANLNQISVKNPVGDGYIGLKVYIAGTGYASTAKTGASDPTISGLWSDNVLIAYLPERVGLKSLAGMKTFERKPTVINRLDRGHIKKGAYKLEIEDKLDEVLVEAKCFYLLTNCI